LLHAMKTYIKNLWLAAAVAAPLVAAAQQPQYAPLPTGISPVPTVTSGLLLFQRILYWFSVAFWIAAGFFVFYAAYLYLTAAGNDERTKKAKQQLLYAVIAIIIAIMAAGLPRLVQSFLLGV